MVLSDRQNAKPGTGAPALSRRRWAFVLFAALLAFTWQSFVTQTHRHPGLGGYSASLARTLDGTSKLGKDGRSSSDSPANCPICQEIAHAGDYLLPTAVAFGAPEPAMSWFVVVRSLTASPRQRSHAWQSRAPPHPLQA
jgi:hypothetical protein